MGTLETLIVFAALMAIIALVGVAIDWVGKPLRNRQFIPRIYRYADEIPARRPAVPATIPAAAGTTQAVPSGPAVTAPRAPVSPSLAPQPPVLPSSPAPVPAPRAKRQAIPASPASSSAFSDSIGRPEVESPRARVATGAELDPVDRWVVGLPLDRRVGDKRPSLATRAERFWRSVAASLPAGSHFDEATVAAMDLGKAPRRRNPRTNSFESMQLVGLRSASDPDDVVMHWPDDAIDPWSNP